MQLPPEIEAQAKAILEGFNLYAVTVDKHNKVDPKFGVTAPSLALASEAGEVAGKVYKILRDADGQITDEDRLAIAYELGDTLWNLMAVARDLKIPFGVVALLNLVKCEDRASRGVIAGSGDNR
jgi:NTP pyrophosphatase (non-canonical NTP hydrolase)